MRRIFWFFLWFFGKKQGKARKRSAACLRAFCLQKPAFLAKVGRLCGKTTKKTGVFSFWRRYAQKKREKSTENHRRVVEIEKRAFLFLRLGEKIGKFLQKPQNLGKNAPKTHEKLRFYGGERKRCFMRLIALCGENKNNTGMKCAKK